MKYTFTTRRQLTEEGCFTTTSKEEADEFLECGDYDRNGMIEWDEYHEWDCGEIDIDEKEIQLISLKLKNPSPEAQKLMEKE